MKNKKTKSASFDNLSGKPSSKIKGEDWLIQDVKGDGNCFYYSLIHQMELMKNNHYEFEEFLNKVPVDTNPADSLRLLIQGKNFKDKEWADLTEIMKFLEKFNVIVAVVDTRVEYKTSDNLSNVYYFYKNQRNEFVPTNKISDLPKNTPVVQLAYTGCHYMSVIKARTDVAQNLQKNLASRKLQERQDGILAKDLQKKENRDSYQILQDEQIAQRLQAEEDAKLAKILQKIEDRALAETLSKWQITESDKLKKNKGSYENKNFHNITFSSVTVNKENLVTKNNIWSNFISWKPLNFKSKMRGLFGNLKSLIEKKNHNKR